MGFKALQSDLARTPLCEDESDDPSFLEAGGLGKSMVLAAARETVEVMDRGIKGLTGSTSYDDPCLKATRLAEMLEAYAALMKTWVRRAPTVRTKARSTADDLLTAMEERRSRLAQEVARDGARATAALRPSPAFSVAAAVLGSATEYKRHAAQTLEELFTLTHQNALAALSMFETQTGLGEDRLPAAVRKVSATIQKTRLPSSSSAASNQTISLMSVDYRLPAVSIHFNAPLRRHSARVSLTTVIGGEQDRLPIDVRVEAFGENREGRLMGVGISGLAWGAAAGMEIAPGGMPVVQDKTVSFTWRLRADSPLFERHLGRLPIAIADVLRMTFESVPAEHVIRSVFARAELEIEEAPTAVASLVKVLPQLEREINKVASETMTSSFEGIAPTASDRGLQELCKDMGTDGQALALATRQYLSSISGSSAELRLSYDEHSRIITVHGSQLITNDAAASINWFRRYGARPILTGRDSDGNLQFRLKYFF